MIVLVDRAMHNIMRRHRYMHISMEIINVIIILYNVIKLAKKNKHNLLRIRT